MYKKELCRIDSVFGHSIVLEIVAKIPFQRHVNYIKTIYHVGYGLSVITLIAAIFIMLHFK